MATQQRTTSSEARARVLLENAANWSRGTAITATGETVGVVLFASATRGGVVYYLMQSSTRSSSKPT